MCIPTILITNDDGISSRGISILTRIAQKYGNVVVVAPDSPHSGMAMAFTSSKPIFCKNIVENKNEYKAFSCSGTPVDCVKMAFDQILEKSPDLVLSGINFGSNASGSTPYSGTIGAVLEGCIHDVPSIGFSLCNYSLDADFSYTEPYIGNIIEQVLKHGLPIGTALNVNFPIGEISGISVCKQGHGRWFNEFNKKNDTFDEISYQAAGTYKNLQPSDKETDDYNLSIGKATIVPIKIDWTDYHFLDKLKDWKF